MTPTRSGRTRGGPASALGLLTIGTVLAGGAGCAAFSPPDRLHPHEPQPRRFVAPAGPLEAGAACVDITPRGSVWMAGFGFFKATEGVHDPITVRALALRRGALTALVVGVDVVGLHHYQVEAARERLADVVTRDAVIVAATHNHAGPDTMGMWGFPVLGVSGLDDEYSERVLASIERAGREAVAALGPVVTRWGTVQATPDLSRNKRDPDLIDRTVTALAFDRPGEGGEPGAPVATLVGFACHPEALGSKNRILSADFPGALYRTVEEQRPGSVTVFLNGALGGMVTTAQRARTFAEVERIGSRLGRLALGAATYGRPLPAEVEMSVSRRPLLVPIQNGRYHLLDALGVFGERPFQDGGYTPSDVMALRLGPLVFLTAPGEVLPRLGFELTGLSDARHTVLISLGNDELGYLIHEADWATERYPYEKTVSPGPLATGLIREAARAALADVGAGAGRVGEAGDVGEAARAVDALPGR